MRRDGLAGWRVEGGVVQPDETIAGYASRNVDVRGRCYLKHCRRSYWFDWSEWLALGMGQVRLQRIQGTLRCHLLTGCNLYFEEQGGAKLTLGFADQRGMFVRLACGKCNAFRLVLAATLIRRFTAEGRGGRDTLVADLAKVANKPCEKCKAKAWSADVISTGGKEPAWLSDALKRRRLKRESLAAQPGPPS